MKCRRLELRAPLATARELIDPGISTRMLRSPCCAACPALVLERKAIVDYAVKLITEARGDNRRGAVARYALARVVVALQREE